MDRDGETNTKKGAEKEVERHIEIERDREEGHTEGEKGI